MVDQKYQEAGPCGTRQIRGTAIVTRPCGAGPCRFSGGPPGHHFFSGTFFLPLFSAM